MKNKNLEINVTLYFFILYSLWIVFGDIITYFLNIDYLYTLLIALPITILFCFVFRKKIRVIYNYSKYDWIFFGLLCLLFIITIVYPDRNFDSFNYHLYLQKKPFGDKIFTDFFAARNLNSFTYAFTDRLFYFFRYLLGYRLGLIFNYIILITIYYQSKKIFNCIINSKNKELLISIFSILCTFTLSTVVLVDSYYVDNISIVYLSELFFLIFYYKNDNYNLIIPYIGLLCGFIFVSKISNMFIVLLLFLFYIIRNKLILKNINIKNILLAILMFIVPIFIYVYYTYISTGNPIFPFYNTIFKSPYYSISNWLDTRFGPHNILEVIIWPFLMQIYPGRSDDVAIVESMWAIGYTISFLSVIAFIIYKIKKKKISINILLYIFIFCAFLIWSKFMLGYTRYGLSVLYFSMIGIYTLLYHLVLKRKKIITTIILLLLSFNYISSLYMYVGKADWWSFSNVFSNNYKQISYKSNLKKVLNDKNYKISLPNNSMIGILSFNAGYASIIFDDIPLISLNSGASNDKTNEILNNYLLNGKKLYTITDSLDFDNFLIYLNESGYDIKNVYGVFNTDFVLEDDFTYIFEIEKSEYQDSYFEFTKDKTVEIEDGKYNLSFYGGLGKKMRPVTFDDCFLEIGIIDSNGNFQLVDSKEIKPFNGNLYLYNNVIEKKENEDIVFRITNKNRETIENITMMILDFKIEKINN